MFLISKIAQVRRNSITLKIILDPTYKWLVYCGYNPLILTFDPNFQPDIQALPSA